MSGAEDSGGDEEGEEEMEQDQDQDEESVEEEDVDTKQVRKGLAVINVDYVPNEPIIFSYHYKYEKYLRDHNLLDPDKAKMAMQKLKRKQ